MTIGPAYGSAGMERAQMLASGADRDRAIDFLKTAFAEGRLDAEHYELRMGKALAARTYADLDTLTIDLPGARPSGPPGTNALAITSLICGIAQIPFSLLATIPAIVCGHLARRQIRRTGEQGAGMAMAGLVLGWAGLALTVVIVTVIAIFVAFVIRSSTALPAG